MVNAANQTPPQLLPQCRFMLAWRGQCTNDGRTISPEVDQIRCPEHMDLTCQQCGKLATHDCAQTMGGLICGAPLCNDCEHADPMKAEPPSQDHVSADGLSDTHQADCRSYADNRPVSARAHARTDSFLARCHAGPGPTRGILPKLPPRHPQNKSTCYQSTEYLDRLGASRSDHATVPPTHAR